MDAINRFTNVQKPIISESEETAQLQTSQQVPSAGIAGTADAFECCQQGCLDLSNLTKPAATITEAQPTETLEASSLFDVLNADNGLAPGDAIGKKLPPAAFVDIGPGDALGKKLPPASYGDILPGDAPEKKLPPYADALPKKLEPAGIGTKFRRLPLTEQHLNEFIQKHLTVADQVPVTQDLKNWIKSNFRLSPAQQAIVDSLSQADIQRAQKAAVRASEVNKKISVEFRDPAFDQQLFVLNKDQKGELDTLQLEENNNSIVLKHLAGCRPEIISQMQDQLKAKTTLS